jgi:hypothetical protein
MESFASTDGTHMHIHATFPRECVRCTPDMRLDRLCRYSLLETLAIGSINPLGWVGKHHPLGWVGT